MMENIIQLNTFKHEHLTIDPPTLSAEYYYNERGKLLWLQRICFWILDKLHAKKQKDTTVVTRHEINLDDLFKAIFENQKMLHSIYRREAKHIIIGWDHFHKLVNTDEGRQMLMFRVPEHYNTPVVIGGVRCQGMFRGLYVILVPYINGMFCLPEIRV